MTTKRRMSTQYKALAAVLAALLLLPSYSSSVCATAQDLEPQASDGGLDVSFGSGGKVMTAFPVQESVCDGLALQADGRVVAVGRVGTGFGLARYNTDGSLDVSFGGVGIVMPDFSGVNSSASSVAIQTNGKIVAVGRVGTTGGARDFGVVRYNNDGSLDPGFQSTGWVSTDFFGFEDWPFSVVAQPDGKVVVGGFAQRSNTTPSRDFALARYNADGGLDTSFGSGGRVTTDFFDQTEHIKALAIQADGRLLAVGFTTGTSIDFALVRYNSDGSLDSSFGNGGKVTTDFNNRLESAEAISVQPDGKIVLAGYTDIAPNTFAFALARYNSDGSLDSSFGPGGRVITSFSGTYELASGVAVLSDGRILASGSTSSTNAFINTSSNFALACYHPDGSLDPNFGAGGKVTTDFSGLGNEAYAMAVQPDGRVVLGGAARTGPDSYTFGLARYTVESAFGLGFEQTSVSSQRGTKAKVTVRISRVGTFTGNVTVTAPDTSAIGVTAKPREVSTAGSSAKFKLKIRGGAASGSHQLTFTGRDDSGRVRTGTVTLVIE
jgi:uncharacterized delta-60 repeat protein